MLKRLYGADGSPYLIPAVTARVVDQLVKWKHRPLDPVVYLDCVVTKIRADDRVQNKAIYLALVCPWADGFYSVLTDTTNR